MDTQKIKRLGGQIAVLDNNVLTDLIEIRRLNLLNDVFRETHIPHSILQEEVLERQVHKLSEVCYSPVSIQTSQGYNHMVEFSRLKPKLSMFDCEVIAIARENNWICVSNEKRIVKLCEMFGIETSGTLGIIGAAYLNGIISMEELGKLTGELFSDRCSCYIGKRTQTEFLKVFNQIEKTKLQVASSI